MTTWLGLLALAAAWAGPAAAAGDEAMAKDALHGEPTVTQYKDGKDAAFTMQFDDSMETQADFAIPEMNKRGLTGSFFINPATERYARRRETWEVLCTKSGHELACHTMHHTGAADMEEADWEIGECARIIWKLQPGVSRLRPFMRGGGTTWGPSREDIAGLMDKYYLYRAPRRFGVSSEEEGRGNPVRQAQKALDEGTWELVGFHGVGGQWISCTEEEFIRLLDFLVEHRDRLWTGTTSEVYKYVQERDAVSKVELADATEEGFSVSIECDPAQVKLYDLTFAELYDMPLTVRVPVPDTWQSFTVTQGDGAPQKLDVIEVDGGRAAQFDVLPNAGSAAVRRES
jgi:peptidoglycan/xylan/chitin deacetylase (PgdA/CDA1 family)